MSLLRSSALRLAALGAVAVLTACTTAGPESQARRPSADQMPGTPMTASTEVHVSASNSADASRTLGLGRKRPTVVSAPEAASESADDHGPPTPLPLPVAEDLGPNYFELLITISASDPGAPDIGQIAAAVVVFGFSERAKLRDERIERDGPLAAVARISRHANATSSDLFASATRSAGRLEPAASDPATNPLGLIAELEPSITSSQDFAPDLTASRSLRTGWFAALDGSRVKIVLEQWTAVRARTVLTVLLVWGNRVSEGWGRALLQRLVQIPVGQELTHAP